jgi:hypothetical protein
VKAIDPEHIERIEAYLNGDAAERAAFERDLESDQALARAFAGYCGLETALREVHTDQLRSALKSVEARLAPVNGNGRSVKLKWLWPLAVAAGVALLVGVFLGMDDDLDRALALWEPEPGLPVRMNTSSAWNPAMNAYKQQQYDDALTLLAPFTSDTADYFRGVIAFEQKRYADAAEQFKLIPSSSAWSREACFREIIALLAAGEKALAGEALARAEGNAALSETQREALRSAIE